MTIKNLIKYFETFTNNHPILQTFSWGNLSDYSREDFITQYPALHVVPLPSTLGETSTDMSFSILIYDLLNEWVDNPINSNQLDSMALTQDILNDFVNEFINQLTDYGYYLQMPIQFTPFTDRFAESVCGVEATITITMEQTSCIPPYIAPSPTPSPTATLTPTPTTTPSACLEYTLRNDNAFPTGYSYDDCCSGNLVNPLVFPGNSETFCGRRGSINTGLLTVVSSGTCSPVCPSPTPTSTTTPTPTPTLTPTPTTSVWEPSQMTNLNEWWRADTGVSLTGSDVDSWEGYNGTLFSPYSPTSLKATYTGSSSNWNGEAAITFNPTSSTSDAGYTAYTSGGSITRTTYFVARMNTISNEKGLFTMENGSSSTTRRAAFIARTTDTPDQAYVYTDGVLSSAFYVNSGVEDSAGSYLFGAIEYDASGATKTLNWYLSNTSTLGGVKQTKSGTLGPYDIGYINLAMYMNSLRLCGPSIDFVEVISVDGLLDSGDLTDLQNYLSSRYGI